MNAASLLSWLARGAEAAAPIIPSAVGRQAAGLAAGALALASEVASSGDAAGPIERIHTAAELIAAARERARQRRGR